MIISHSTLSEHLLPSTFDAKREVHDALYDCYIQRDHMIVF
ncbi:hypothetical protein NB550_11115 [Vibrio parahaemolyticus]|nr:hypothetical protein [Vibrio parahaemolyticus]MCR9888109.1 hypothetical protein [Vibrio parahaemolyticus]MCR9918039.1 hypothetical protein [Vibrio parahaemolyticus]